MDVPIMPRFFCLVHNPIPCCAALLTSIASLLYDLHTSYQSIVVSRHPLTLVPRIVHVSMATKTTSRPQFPHSSGTVKIFGQQFELCPEERMHYLDGGDWLRSVDGEGLETGRVGVGYTCRLTCTNKNIIGGCR